MTGNSGIHERNAQTLNLRNLSGIQMRNLRWPENQQKDQFKKVQGTMNIISFLSAREAMWISEKTYASVCNAKQDCSAGETCDSGISWRKRTVGDLLQEST